MSYKLRWIAQLAITILFVGNCTRREVVVEVSPNTEAATAGDIEITPHGVGTGDGSSAEPGGGTRAPTSTPIPENPLNKRSKELLDFVETRLKEKAADARGITWETTKADLRSGWLLGSIKTPWDSSKIRPKPGLCSGGAPKCQIQFMRPLCKSDSDCEDKNLTCAPLLATVNKVGKEPDKVCQFPSDFLLDELYTLITKTEKKLDFTSLSAPTGLFHQAFVNALSMVSQKSKDVKVRILMCGEDDKKPILLQNPDKYLQRVRDDIVKMNGHLDSLQFNLAWLSSHSQPSWNHTKIIIVDNKFGFQGGHNWWDDDYLGATPVYDLSMYFQGRAIKETSAFVDTLWSHVDDFFAIYSNGERFSPFALEGSFENSGRADVMTLGRLGSWGYNSSDEAFGALIDGAKEEIFISQQDLFNGTSIVSTDLNRPIVENNMFEAILRKVKIKIIQSNRGNMDYGMVAFDKALGALKKAFVKYVKNLKTQLPDGTQNAKDYFCKMLEYYPFRYSKDWSVWANGNNILIHTKLIVVDKAAFYIGSQNIYPANLQEFGMAIYNADYTEELVKNYWEPAFSAASNSVENPCDSL